MPRLICVALTALLLPAHALDKPARQKTVTLIVPFTHGGPTDEIAQTLAQGLAASLQQKVVARNVPGAGGTLGAEQAARSRPDGQTLLLFNIGQAARGALYRKLRYDPVKSFEPIGLVAEVPMTLVASPRIAAADFEELRRAIAAAQPRLTFAHAGVGSASHLCGLMLVDALKADLAAVSYPGTADAVADLAEAGLPNFQLAVWHGLYAPKGTPGAEVARLSKALREARQSADMKQKLAELGAVPSVTHAGTPEASRKRLEGDIAHLAPLLKRTNAPRRTASS